MISGVVESLSQKEYIVKVGSKMYLVKLDAEKDTNVEDIYQALQKMELKPLPSI
ncbi:MAG: hypothetical protein QG670_1484 [Thermoproteota archaeon]|nr:hypothetical protein [Thermoproteota archaeon]